MGTPRRDRRNEDPPPTREGQDDRRDIAPPQNAVIEASEDAVDRAIEMTFPASDPPAWTAS
jgi:hypothetical protein